MFLSAVLYRFPWLNSLSCFSHLFRKCYSPLSAHVVLCRDYLFCFVFFFAPFFYHYPKHWRWRALPLVDSTYRSRTLFRSHRFYSSHCFVIFSSSSFFRSFCFSITPCPSFPYFYLCLSSIIQFSVLLCILLQQTEYPRTHILMYWTVCVCVCVLHYLNQ